MPTLRSLAIAPILVAGVALGPTAAEEWPQFLGPSRDGRSADAALAAAWSRSGLEERWRIPIGSGYSGLAVADGRVFGMDSEGGSELVFALRASDGGTLWRLRTGISPPDVYGGDGPRATPAVAAGRVHVVSGEGALLALDAASGRIAWRRDLAKDLGWRRPAEGTAGSHLLADGRVYVLNGGSDGRAFAALDAQTGRTLWTSQDDRTSYTSPVRWDVGGVAQTLFLSGSALFSLDPATGRRLWRYEWATFDAVNAATPLAIEPDRVFISSGHDQGGALLRVRPGPGGLVTEEVWRNREMRNHFNNSVHSEGVLYGFDESILKAIDALNGRRLWRERGFGKGSLVLLAGRLVILSEDGELILAHADRSGLEIQVRQSVLSGRCWTPPSIAGGRIYLRGRDEIVALEPTPVP